MLLYSTGASPPPSFSSSPSFWIAQAISALLLCPPDLIERRVPMIAPFPGTWEDSRRRNVVDQIIDECWKNPNAGYEVQPTDEWIVNNQQQQQLDSRDRFDILEQEQLDENGEIIATSGKPSTYGEITPLGARQLFGAMGLLDSHRDNHDQRRHPAHFFDLGSGTGKLVGQAVLELPNKTIKKATGIELSPSRHESAIRAMESLLQLPQSNNDWVNSIEFSHNDSNGFLTEEYFVRSTNKLELLQGDLFDVDLSTATHIYVASLCFPDALMVELEERLQILMHKHETQEQACNQNETDEMGEVQEVGELSSLQWVATLKPFPTNLGGIRPSIRFMEMSWTKPYGCAVYLYRCNSTAATEK